MTPRERLLERVNRNGPLNNFDLPRPLVTLEEFFEGNHDPGSIGYNLNLEGDYVQEIYRAFKLIRARPEVAGVFVLVQDQEDPDGWPSSDTIWVLTSVEPNELQSWLANPLRGDDIHVGWPDYPTERVAVPAGMRPLGVWWD